MESNTDTDIINTKADNTLTQDQYTTQWIDPQPVDSLEILGYTLVNGIFELANYTGFKVIWGIEQ